MLQSRAREIAEVELRRINALLGLDLRISSAQSLPGTWMFLTASERLKAIFVHDHGRVIHALMLGRPVVQLEKLRASDADPSDLQWLIPRNKGDFDRAHAVVALGYPAVEPILPELLRWLRDMNWPITRVLGAFLAGIGAPLAPYLRRILSGDDGTWKYWIIGSVIGANRELFELFKDDLQRMANNPTPEERTEEIDQQAREILEEGPTPWPPAKPPSGDSGDM
jgi:hypothetical protein